MTRATVSESIDSECGTIAHAARRPLTLAEMHYPDDDAPAVRVARRLAALESRAFARRLTLGFALGRGGRSL